MEDGREDMVLILAGYPREMDRFLSMNPGLESRFPFILDFDDYSVDELLNIGNRMLSERQYQLSKQAEWKFRNHLAKNCGKITIIFRMRDMCGM